MNWSSPTHPISDIREWKRSSRLELQPDFQRNVVWTKSAQIALIDTILREIPFPKIYIKAKIRDENTYRIVIDGQQRMTAILEFVENRLRLKKTHLSAQFETYDGKLFHELPNEARNRVLQYKVDFNELADPSDEEVRDMYARINKYTVQLNKQELRRADYPGDLMSVAEELSDFPYFDEAKMFSAGQKRRMLDVEFILELLCIILEGEQDKKDCLDDFCDRYVTLNGTFPEENNGCLRNIIPKLFCAENPNGEQPAEMEGFLVRLSRMSDGGKALVYRFCKILADVAIIFEKSFPIAQTRFKQKADFYSLFSCINEYQKCGRSLSDDKLSEIRVKLRDLNSGIAPHSDDQAFSDYAIRCISDANSLSTRKWRREFLDKHLSFAYTKDPTLQ